MKHRIRAAGLLVQGDSILLIRHNMNGVACWVPPGGGLEPEDATTRDTVVREVHEEAGLKVHEVGPLVYMREFKETSQQVYHVEQFYQINSWSGEIHLNNLQGLGGDEHIISEARFIARSELAQLNVFPRELRDDFWERIQRVPVSPVHLGTEEESLNVQF